MLFAVTTPHTPHDAIFWSTVAQACGSVIIVFATVALVWVTGLLVKATNRLAIVGEQTWKSNIAANVWVMCDEGKVTALQSPTIRIKNSCGVDLLRVHASLFPTIFRIDSSGKYLDDACSIHGHRYFELGDLETNAGAEIHYWDVALECLDAPTKYAKDIFSHNGADDPSTRLVSGFILSTSFMQSVTNEVFTKASRFQIDDAGKTSLRIKFLDDDPSLPLK